MIQNSLPRLLTGIADVLSTEVLPAISDDFARAQVAACIELVGNIATRVEWRADYLGEVTARAEDAIAAAVAAAPELDAELAPAGGSDPLSARDRALARVSSALRWCDRHDADDAVVTPLVGFASWHVAYELDLLRTGMFRR